MRKFVIERVLPGAGQMTPEQLSSVAAKSNAVLSELGTRIQWLHSYVTDERLFCVYNSDSEELIREHARRGGFPCDNVRPVGAIIDPVTRDA